MSVVYRTDEITITESSNGFCVNSKDGKRAYFSKERDCCLPNLGG